MNGYMSDIKRTFYTWTDTQAIAVGETVADEGQALVAVLENGVEKVKPATGDQREVFVGFALYRQKSFTTAAVVEDHVVPTAAPYVVDLAKNNLVATQIRVEGADANAVHEVNGTVTFLIGDAGKAVRIFYRYQLTAQEAQRQFYEAVTNYPDPNYFQSVGVGKGKGRLYTLLFDQSVDWSDPVNVPTAGAIGAANGQIVLQGTTIPNARVVSVPNPLDPYLGIEFNF